MDVIYVLPDYYSRNPKPCIGGWASRQLTVTLNGDAARTDPGLSPARTGFAGQPASRVERASRSRG